MAVADESVDFGIILLLRQKGITVFSISERIELVAKIIEKYFSELYNNFSVIDKRGIRIKTAHNRG